MGAQIFFSESRVQGTHNAAVLDLGAQYVSGGTARYLTKGSIVDLPDAKIAITPRESRTDMMIVRIGARVQR